MTAARTIWHLDGHDATRELVLPIEGVRVVSESNEREHHMAKWRRGKAQQKTVRLLLSLALSFEPIAGPWAVTLTRLIGPRGKVLDDDNNVGGFKMVRDQVAKCLDVDDGDPRVTWAYDQRKDKAWGIEIRIRRVV